MQRQARVPTEVHPFTIYWHHVWKLAIEEDSPSTDFPVEDRVGRAATEDYHP